MIQYVSCWTSIKLQLECCCQINFTERKQMFFQIFFRRFNAFVFLCCPTIIYNHLEFRAAVNNALLLCITMLDNSVH